MKDLNLQERVRKVKEEHMRRIAEEYGPERAARVKAVRKAYGSWLFKVTGYCDLCGGEIHNFDRRVMHGEDCNLCLDCFLDKMNAEFDAKQQGQASTVAINIDLGRKVQWLK